VSNGEFSPVPDALFIPYYSNELIFGSPRRLFNIPAQISLTIPEYLDINDRFWPRWYT